MAEKLTNDSIRQPEILAGWKRDICNQADRVDPSNDLCWESLWLGYAIAKGMSPEGAYQIYLSHAYPLESILTPDPKDSIISA